MNKKELAKLLLKHPLIKKINESQMWDKSVVSRVIAEELMSEQDRNQSIEDMEAAIELLKKQIAEKRQALLDAGKSWRQALEFDEDDAGDWKELMTQLDTERRAKKKQLDAMEASYEELKNKAAETPPLEDDAVVTKSATEDTEQIKDIDLDVLNPKKINPNVAPEQLADVVGDELLKINTDKVEKVAKAMASASPKQEKPLDVSSSVRGAFSNYMKKFTGQDKLKEFQRLKEGFINADITTISEVYKNFSKLSEEAQQEKARLYSDYAKKWNTSKREQNLTPEVVEQQVEELESGVEKIESTIDKAKNTVLKYIGDEFKNYKVLQIPTFISLLRFALEQRVVSEQVKDRPKLYDPERIQQIFSSADLKSEIDAIDAHLNGKLREFVRQKYNIDLEDESGALNKVEEPPEDAEKEQGVIPSDETKPEEQAAKPDRDAYISIAEVVASLNPVLNSNSLFKNDLFKLYVGWWLVDVGAETLNEFVTEVPESNFTKFFNSDLIDSDEFNQMKAEIDKDLENFKSLIQTLQKITKTPEVETKDGELTLRDASGDLMVKAKKDQAGELVVRGPAIDNTEPEADAIDDAEPETDAIDDTAPEESGEQAQAEDAQKPSISKEEEYKEHIEVFDNFFSLDGANDGFMEQFLLKYQSQKLWQFIGELSKIAMEGEERALSGKPEETAAGAETEEEEGTELRTGDDTSAELEEVFNPFKREKEDVVIPKEAKAELKTSLVALLGALKKLRGMTKSYEQNMMKSSANPALDGSSLMAQIQRFLPDIQDSIAKIVERSYESIIEQNRLKDLESKEAEEPQADEPPAEEDAEEQEVNELLREVFLEEEAGMSREDKIQIVDAKYQEMRQFYMGGFQEILKAGNVKEAIPAADEMLKLAREEKFISMFPSALVGKSGKPHSVKDAVVVLSDLIQTFIQTMKDVVMLVKKDVIPAETLSSVVSDLTEISMQLEEYFKVDSKIDPELKAKLEKFLAKKPENQSLTDTPQQKTSGVLGALKDLWNKLKEKFNWLSEELLKKISESIPKAELEPFLIDLNKQVRWFDNLDETEQDALNTLISELGKEPGMKVRMSEAPFDKIWTGLGKNRPFSNAMKKIGFDEGFMKVFSVVMTRFKLKRKEVFQTLEKMMQSNPKDFASFLNPFFELKGPESFQTINQVIFDRPALPGASSIPDFDPNAEPLDDEIPEFDVKDHYGMNWQDIFKKLALGNVPTGSEDPLDEMLEDENLGEITKKAISMNKNVFKREMPSLQKDFIEMVEVLQSIETHFEPTRERTNENVFKQGVKAFNRMGAKRDLIKRVSKLEGRQFEGSIGKFKKDLKGLKLNFLVPEQPGHEFWDKLQNSFFKQFKSQESGQSPFGEPDFGSIEETLREALKPIIAKMLKEHHG